MMMMRRRRRRRGGGDMNMYLIFSAFISRPTSLLACHSFCVFLNITNGPPKK
jgi:hypothetical protein